MSNKIINLPTLITRLANEAGTDPAASRRFIHEVFDLIFDELSKGESVEIPGIGMFAPHFSSENPVLFKPDSALEETINEPFSAFSPVEVFDGAESMISETVAEIKEAPTHENLPEEVSEPTNSEEVIEYSMQEEPLEKEKSAESLPTPPKIPMPPFTSAQSNIPPIPTPPEPVQEEVTKSPVAEEKVQSSPYHPASHQEIIPSTEVSPAPSTVDATEPSRPKQSTSLWLVLGIMIGLVAGLVGGFFAGKAMGRIEAQFIEEEFDDEDEAQEEDTSGTVNISDSIFTPQSTESQPETPKAPVVEAPSVKEPVYDTVETTLASLAKKHYGNTNYWVFIYQANPQLGNPSKVAKGTRVVIPAKEEFAASSPEATDTKARNLLNEISKKYKI